MGAPRPHAGLGEATANRGGGIVVGRHAEGGDHLPGTEADPQGDHVDPPVPERESDDVTHGVGLAPGVAPSRAAPGAFVTGRGASDQRQDSGTASTCPASVRRWTTVVRTRPTGTGPPAHASIRNVSEVVRWLPRRSAGGSWVRSR